MPCVVRLFVNTDFVHTTLVSISLPVCPAEQGYQDFLIFLLRYLYVEKNDTLSLEHNIGPVVRNSKSQNGAAAYKDGGI